MNNAHDILNAYTDGVLTERDRIIKLLEEWPICEEGCYCLPCDLGETDALRKEFANLIALIRGEN